MKESQVGLSELAGHLNWRGDNPISHLSGAFASGPTDDAKFFGEEFDFSARLDQSSKVRSPRYDPTFWTNGTLPAGNVSSGAIRSTDNNTSRRCASETAGRTSKGSKFRHRPSRKPALHVGPRVPRSRVLTHRSCFPDHHTAHTLFQAHIHTSFPPHLRPIVFHSEVP